MCGIIGIHNHPEAATLAYLGLHGLQHRGQESAGMVTVKDSGLQCHHAMGLVADIFSQDVIDRLQANHAIGHVRYSTYGESHIKNCQPFLVNSMLGSMAVAHNGNLVNATEIQKKLEEDGAIFQSTMDTEVIVHLMAKSRKKKFIDRLKESLCQVEGAFSLLFLTKKKMIAVRDPSGFRPLVMGKKKDSWIVASETTALDLIGAKFVREIEPGEIVVFENGDYKSYRLAENLPKRSHCIFEYVYFAKPDSHIFHRDVYEVRKGFGQMLAKESQVDGDIVVPVPDSGVPAAIGYAQESGIPFEMGLVRNHYVGRTFIEPEQSIRHFGVKLKLGAVKNIIEGKRVVLIDDSIVRGTTSKKIVRMLRDAGAKEIHMRISSPPTKWPCFYGIDTPTRSELIAAKKSIKEIRNYIGVDSLKYLSVDSLYWFEKQSQREWFCDACFTGKYPVGSDVISNLI
ncbi:MAG: amidophosphoribosyltransferase [bacterium]|nr:amidophosphoribosyltransferase [bacterium]MBU1917797.1 amidophosphoribosyltransferase [bacterium]